MQNMWISIGLIILIIVAGLIVGTRLSAPGSQRRAITWSFGVLTLLVLLFFIFISITPGDWIVPLFTVLCIVLPICAYVIVSRLPQRRSSGVNERSGFSKKDFSLPKGTPNTLQAKAPEGPKPPTAQEKAAAEAAAAAKKPAPLTPAPAKKSPAAPTSSGTAAGVSGIPLSPQPSKAAQKPAQPTKPETKPETKPAQKPKAESTAKIDIKPSIEPESKTPPGFAVQKPSAQNKDKPKKEEPKIVEVDLRALDKGVHAAAPEPEPELDNIVLTELPDTLRAPASKAPSSEEAAAIIAAAEDYLAENIPSTNATEITEEIPVIDMDNSDTVAFKSLEEARDLGAKLEAIFDQTMAEVEAEKASAKETEPQPETAPELPLANAQSPAPEAEQTPEPEPVQESESTPEPAPAPKPKPQSKADQYMAFRAKAASLGGQGNYAVAAVLYAQASAAAPTSQEARNAKFDELACYVKADDIAKAKALATQLRQSSVLTRFERLKLDAVERMS